MESMNEMSVSEVKAILSNPQDRDELMLAINSIEAKWKESMKLWEPISLIITLQNERIAKVLPGEGKLFKLLGGDDYQIQYIVSGKVGGKDKKIESNQRWRIHPTKGLVLTTINEMDYMDILNLSVTNWSEQIIKFKEENIEYYEYEYPWGVLLTSSPSIRKAVGVKGDMSLSSRSNELVEKTVNHYKYQIDKLLNKPDTKVEFK